MLITINVTSAQFEAAAFVSTYLEDVNQGRENIGLVGNPIYTWIFDYVYKKDNILLFYDDPRYDPSKTDKILVISDFHFQKTIAKSSHERLKMLYQNSSMIASFGESRDKIPSSSYPYRNLNQIEEWRGTIEVRLANVSKSR